ncbi:MAG: methylated-DNA--[protein]-cysteine S-methyltransferase [Candidatus Saccharibacteria bacterium]
MNSPIGDVQIEMRGDTVIGVHYSSLPDVESSTAVQHQLAEYFSGKRVNFDVTVEPDGTIFQKQVWEEMRKIPFGETATYVDIAKRIDRPEAWRAVANACGANPIVIIIPCHRVVGSYGKLGGYSGGLERKQWLLAHEQAVASRIHRK